VRQLARSPQEPDRPAAVFDVHPKTEVGQVHHRFGLGRSVDRFVRDVMLLDELLHPQATTASRHPVDLKEIFLPCGVFGRDRHRTPLLVVPVAAARLIDRVLTRSHGVR
jgi:hypothetical protein